MHLSVKIIHSSKCECFMVTDFHVSYATLLKKNMHLKTRQCLKQDMMKSTDEAVTCLVFL